jgi:hypothetical protein
MVTQQSAEPGDVTGDDRVRGVLEPDDTRILPIQSFDVQQQLRPALDAVQPRDDELGVGKCELMLPDLFVVSPRNRG